MTPKRFEGKFKGVLVGSSVLSHSNYLKLEWDSTAPYGVVLMLSTSRSYPVPGRTLWCRACAPAFTFPPRGRHSRGKCTVRPYASEVYHACRCLWPILQRPCLSQSQWRTWVFT